MIKIRKTIFAVAALMSLSGVLLTGCASSGGVSGSGAGGYQDEVRDSGSSLPIGTHGSLDTGAASGARPDVGPGAATSTDFNSTDTTTDTDSSAH